MNLTRMTHRARGLFTVASAAECVAYGVKDIDEGARRVLRAQRYVEEGRRWVVDVDLEKFFDRVDHDVLMGRLVRRVSDTRLLRLIRRYLNAGMMANGVVMERDRFTFLAHASCLNGNPY